MFINFIYSNTQTNQYLNIKFSKAIHIMIGAFQAFSNPFPLRTLIGKTNYFFNDIGKLGEQSQKLKNLLQKNDTIRLWSLQQLSQSNEFSPNNKQTNQTNIVVNKYFSTLQGSSQRSSSSLKDKNHSDKRMLMHKNLINYLNRSNNWVFLPNFYSILTQCRHAKNNGLDLLIGDYHEYFMSTYSNNEAQFITLQELCAMYPQKVPLSYRGRQEIENIKANVEVRVPNYVKAHGKKLSEEPKISEIIICNDKIKMWDEAYQIMLDELPCKITVPFHCKEQGQDFYKLSLSDFIEGFKTSHRIIHPTVALEIDYQNCRGFLKEVLENLSRIKSGQIKKEYKIQIMDSEMKFQNQVGPSPRKSLQNQDLDKLRIKK